MTQCCDANGNCTQGADCAIRKQKVVNDAYANGKPDTNPYDDTLGTFSELVAVIILAASMGLVYFVIWWNL
jgi:hypothetical protein